jgi:hypothetical protein
MKTAKKSRLDREEKPSNSDFDFFDIHEDTIAEHWLDQPRLVLQHGLKAADAKDEQDRAKARLDVVRAEVGDEIRKDPERFGLEKTTEASIAMAVTLDDRVRKAENDVFDARHKTEILQAVLTALEHRKRALEGLVTLRGQGYFAEPQANTSGAREYADKMVKRGIRSARRKDVE